MPSKSKAQRNFMAAAAHNPAFAKKVGIPESVAKEFNSADKGKKFSKGGFTVPKDRINRQTVRRGRLGTPFASLNKYAGMAEGGDVVESKKMMKKEVEFFKKKGAPKSMIKHEEAEMESTGKAKKFADGGATGLDRAAAMSGRTVGRMLNRPDAAARPAAPARPVAATGRPELAGVNRAALMSGRALPRMARGGGIESKGKTQGKAVKMARGGGIESKGKTKGRMC